MEMGSKSKIESPRATEGRGFDAHSGRVTGRGGHHPLHGQHRVPGRRTPSLHPPLPCLVRNTEDRTSAQTILIFLPPPPTRGKPLRTPNGGTYRKQPE